MGKEPAGFEFFFPYILCNELNIWIGYIIKEEWTGKADHQNDFEWLKAKQEIMILNEEWREINDQFYWLW